MSETEHVKGILHQIRAGTDVETICQDILRGMGKDELCKYSESWKEMLEEHTDYKMYHMTHDAVYEMKITETDPDDEIAFALKNPDGSINFELRWYNGGACMSEVLDQAMRKIKS